MRAAGTPGPDDEKPVTVIFRKWRKNDYTGDGIIALFPDVLPESYGNVLSYEHVGQHGDAHYGNVIAGTVPATPDEYAALKRELEAPPYEYKLAVRRRRPGRQHRA